MTAPCRSDCPAGDCAGCAFPTRAQCDPSVYCDQHYRCARRVTSLCSPTEQHVDGMALRNPSGGWCPIFVDTRSALLEAA